MRVPRWNGGSVSILVPEQIIITDAAFVGYEPVQFSGFIGWIYPATTFDAFPYHQPITFTGVFGVISASG